MTAHPHWMQMITNWMQMIRICVFTLFLMLLLIKVNSIINKPRELIMKCSKQECGHLTCLKYDQQMEWFLTEPEELTI